MVKSSFKSATVIVSAYLVASEFTDEGGCENIIPEYNIAIK